MVIALLDHGFELRHGPMARVALKTALPDVRHGEIVAPRDLFVGAKVAMIYPEPKKNCRRKGR